jgi:hypothetical protein
MENGHPFFVDIREYSQRKQLQQMPLTYVAFCISLRKQKNQRSTLFFVISILSVLEERDLDDMLTADPVQNVEWIKRDKKTRPLIRLTVGDEIIPIIAGLETSQSNVGSTCTRFN